MFWFLVKYYSQVKLFFSFLLSQWMFEFFCSTTPSAESNQLLHCRPILIQSKKKMQTIKVEGLLKPQNKIKIHELRADGHATTGHNCVIDFGGKHVISLGN